MANSYQRYDVIVDMLRKEALNPHGWLSDMHHYHLEFDAQGDRITFGDGSIDLGHLASLIESMIDDGVPTED